MKIKDLIKHLQRYNVDDEVLSADIKFSQEGGFIYSQFCEDFKCKKVPQLAINDVSGE